MQLHEGLLFNKPIGYLAEMTVQKTWLSLAFADEVLQCLEPIRMEQPQVE